MKNGTWKKVELRMARDVGTERIPVTGERDGADFQTATHAYQLKVRKVLPAWMWTWLGGIVAVAAKTGRVGVLVLKLPGQRDCESLVVMRWADHCDIVGNPKAVNE